MDEETYKTKLRLVKVAEAKVKHEKKMFTADDLTEAHLPVYLDKLQSIKNMLGAFNEAVTDITVDLDEGNATDSQRMRDLGARETSLQDEIKVNEKTVIEKAKLLFEALSQNPAGLEQTNKEKERFDREKERAEAAKIKNEKKVLNERCVRQ